METKLTVTETKPKELIKPMKVEELLENERVLEALCETRNSCGSGNSSIGTSDDILF